MLLVLAICAALAADALAQQPPADTARYALDVRGRPMAEALDALAARTDLPLTYAPDAVAGQRSRCRRQEATAPDLLRCVLRGTELRVRKLPSGTYLVEKISSSEARTVSGYVEDAASGERLAGATVYAPALERGTATNRYGFYSLSLPAGPVRLVVSYTGYAPRADTLRGRDDVRRTTRLDARAVLMDDLTVEQARLEPARRIEDRVQMSQVRVPVRQIETAPTLLGEDDVLKTLQLLPGVKSGVEGTSGLYVRGGTPGQNLILLDGTPVYNASHLFGFLSVFNTDAVRDVEITKGGFPARYGGRLSSVVEINLREGNRKQRRVQGAVGLLASRLTVEGPIVEDRTSFLVSGRRTYADLLARPFWGDEGRPIAYFYDVTAKVNHEFSARDRVYGSFYAGGDRFGVEEDAIGGRTAFGWGNVTGALRWNHVFGDKLFADAALTFSRYQFDVGIDQDATGGDGQFRLRYTSGIRDWGATVDVEWAAAAQHRVRFGAKGALQSFRPGALQYEASDLDTAPLDTAFSTQTIRGLHAAAYVEDDWTITPRLRANLGVRAAAFSVDGKTYASVQPRLAARLRLPGGVALKGSFAASRQPIHLLTNSGVGLPTDLWVPATGRIPPQSAWQAGLGLARSFQEGRYAVSLEGYYKQMDNVIAYESGASYVNTTADFDEQVTTGRGRAYGVEVLAQRQEGRTTGWLGYTLAWSQRRFDDLNGGDAFPHRYDRRHELSLTVTHRLSDAFDVSGTWQYTTGNAVTLPQGYFYSDDRPLTTPRPLGGESRQAQYYGERNGFRMPAYHRLDLGVDWYLARGWPEHVLSVGFYNAYNRKNPNYFYLDRRRSDGRTVARATALFPLLPYVNYRFAF